MGQKPRFSGGFGFFWGAGLGAARRASRQGWREGGTDKALGGRLWRGFGARWVRSGRASGGYMCGKANSGENRRYQDKQARHIISRYQFYSRK